MPTLDIAARAAETAEILAQRAREACGYAEAYGHNGRTIVCDGSQFSPSDRVLPGAEAVWALEDPDAWQDYTERLDYFLSGLQVPCGDSDAQADDPDYVWTFGWDDGCLWGFHPDRNLEEE